MFEHFKLKDVQIKSNRELGHGSYASVLELEYMGLKYAGKKIHEVLKEHNDSQNYCLCRFKEECIIHCQLRHPNVVQFLGVFFQQGACVPMLVMEFLPTNLTSCIEKYCIMPNEVNYSILHDVAVGLKYLHGQTPPIIHRDLSSNNVLLTPNMTAKISDFGMAMTFNDTTPLRQASYMTQMPGTPAYMPPEVMIENPQYDTSIDVFSYGIMMIHTFSGQWPVPHEVSVRMEAGRPIPVTEAERRWKFLNKCQISHPLKELILKCIHNYPKERACLREIVESMKEMVSQYPASYSDRVAMLRHIC